MIICCIIFVKLTLFYEILLSTSIFISVDIQSFDRSFMFDSVDVVYTYKSLVLLNRHRLDVCWRFWYIIFFNVPKLFPNICLLIRF